VSTELIDVLTNCPRLNISCLDKGFVRLMDVMPRLVPANADGKYTADCAIVQAARVSYGHGTKTVNEDRGLIRYLMRHQHSTPMEMVEWKFHCKMPIFVARQWIRHRTANVNEVSGRYSVLNDEFYLPDVDNIRQQSKTNRQGGDEKITNTDAEGFLQYIDSLCSNAYKKYTEALSVGIAREQARMILPVSLYTEWYWKIDLHNLFHFLALRCDSHAQYEIRVFAEAMLELITPIVPVAVEAWNDYHPMRGAVKLTRLEVEVLRDFFKKLDWYGLEKPDLNSDNKRERAEWEEKAKLLGWM
jgi:thymidylate synthase (FAD)